MKVVVFEDEFVARLYPTTVGRPAYAISCGGYRLIDWLARLELPLTGIVRNHLLEIQSHDFPELSTADSQDPARLWVNARLVPSWQVFRNLKKILDDRQPTIVYSGQEIAAFLLPDGLASAAAPDGAEDLAAYFRCSAIAKLQPLEIELPLLAYPHDVVRHNQTILIENLEHRLATGNYREIADGIFAAPGATLGAYGVSDTQNGPIVLEENASIGPYCYLSGPAYVGRAARVTEHSAIKDGVSLGHTTKIGGEVEASVIEPYTNKQHYGFLGHSYLGSWINLGAGTCNSDLKNTYGTVNMEYRGEKIPTGMQFVGCILGDYAKSAINTGIFTGKTVGVCSMLYGFITTNVPSFVNYARFFGQVTELPVEVMVATQQRMFVRRKVTQRPCDEQLLHAMYDLTRDERQMAGEPLSL